MIPRLCLPEQCTTHGSELPDFCPKGFLRQFEMISETGNAVEFGRSAIDHFPGEPDIILFQGRAAANAADIPNLLSHRPAPSCPDTVSYHDRQQSD